MSYSPADFVNDVAELLDRFEIQKQPDDRGDVPLDFLRERITDALEQRQDLLTALREARSILHAIDKHQPYTVGALYDAIAHSDAATAKAVKS